MDVEDRVVNVSSHKRSVSNVRALFARCGKINNVYPWKTDNSDTYHYFVEFAGPKSVALAKLESSAGLAVHCLARNTGMMERFRCLSSGTPYISNQETPKRSISSIEGTSAPLSSGRSSRLPDSQSSSKKPRLGATPPGYSNSSRHGSSYKDNRRELAPSPHPHDSSRRLRSSERLRHYASTPIRPRQTRNSGRPLSAKPNSILSTDVTPVPHKDGKNSHSIVAVSPGTTCSGDVTRTSKAAQNELSNATEPFATTQLSFNKPGIPVPSVPVPPCLPEAQLEKALQRLPSVQHVLSLPTRTPIHLSSESPFSYQFPVTTSKVAPTRAPGSDRAYFPLDTLIASARASSEASLSGLPPPIEGFSDELAEDPTDVTTKLINSVSGPDAWMTVAAQYRRQELHESALTVVKTMLTVMKGRGMSEEELKPAFLLMAQCEHSIAKMRRKGDSDHHKDSATQHFISLLSWLQRVYGKETPAADAVAQPGIPILPPSPTTVAPRDKENSPPPEQPVRREEKLSPREPFRSLVNSGKCPSSPTRTSSLASSRDAVDEPRVSRLKPISSVDALTAAREARNSAEAALREERAKCRSLETQVWKLEKELQRLRGAEGAACERANQEAESRVRLQDRMEEDRRAWLRWEKDVQDDITKRVLLEVSSLLGTASQVPSRLWDMSAYFRGDQWR